MKFYAQRPRVAHTPSPRPMTPPTRARFDPEGYVARGHVAQRLDSRSVCAPFTVAYDGEARASHGEVREERADNPTWSWMRRQTRSATR